MSIIRTRYRPATDRTGSRIRATHGRDSLTVPYDYAMSGPENHRDAAKALALKLGMRGHNWARAWDPHQSDGLTFVNADEMRHYDGFGTHG